MLALSAAAGCTRSPSSPGAGEGLTAVHSVEFSHPETDDHEHEEGEDPHTFQRVGFHEFGEVHVGEVVRHVFELENTDPVPVVIQEMLTSCGCSTPNVWYTDPVTGEDVYGRPHNTGQILAVPPGATAHLEVEIDSSRVTKKNTDRLVSIRLTTDSKNAPYKTLECHIVVVQPFRLTPEKLDLGTVASSAGGSASVEIFRDVANAGDLVGLEPLPDGVWPTCARSSARA